MNDIRTLLERTMREAWGEFERIVRPKLEAALQRARGTNKPSAHFLAPRLRGFAARSPEERRAAGSKGGRRAHVLGKAHKLTSEEAKIASRIAHERGTLHKWTREEARAAHLKGRRAIQRRTTLYDKVVSVLEATRVPLTRKEIIAAAELDPSRARHLTRVLKRLQREGLVSMNRREQWALIGVADVHARSSTREVARFLACKARERALEVASALRDHAGR